MFIVLVISYSFQHQPISRSDCHVDTVFSKCVGQEMVLIKVAMESLNHCSDHLSDLIVEEALSLEIEMDELKCSWIAGISHFVGVLIDVHVIIGLQLNHESHTCLLVWSHVSCVVVVLLCSSECSLENFVQLFFLFFTQSCLVHVFNELWILCKVRNVS